MGVLPNVLHKRFLLLKKILNFAQLIGPIKCNTISQWLSRKITTSFMDCVDSLELECPLIS